MSREKWYAGIRTKQSIIGAKSFVGSRIPGEKFSDRTSDPEAKDYDEATEIFLNGVRLARSGDVDAAIPQIACAYLLDGRSINYGPIGHPMPGNINDAGQYRNCVVDYDLLRTLVEHDESSFGGNCVLRLMLALWMGPHPEYGQELIAAALVHVDAVLQYIEDHREIERPDSMILGGCLTRKALLRQRSSLYMAMGNYKKAVKDLTRALKIDEYYTPARDARACVWAGARLKEAYKIHEEFKRITEENHVDGRGNEVAYAWLALTTLEDPSLGSFEDARGYYEKSLEATKRRDEIYGNRTAEDLPDVVKRLRHRFQEGNSSAAFQKDISSITNVVRGTSLGGDAPKNKRLCLKCGAMAGEGGGGLSQCSRCKAVYYCSRKCQVDDWKNHKRSCKILGSHRTAPQAPQRSDQPRNAPEISVAQEKLDQWTSNVQTGKRCEVKFGDIFRLYGKGFSEWWDYMSFGEKKTLLLDVTYDSIPLEVPSNAEILRELRGQESQIKSRALFDYNVRSLCGKCECDGSCDHYFNGRILHEMSDWAHRPNQKDDENIAISIDKRKSGIFPDLFHGKAAFVTPVTKGEVMDPPFVFTADAPVAEVHKFRDYVARGLMYDASVAQFATVRKIYSLTLLIKLFDEYQVRVRRIPPTNPLERLLGCKHCDRSCQGGSSKVCSVCKISWFCCEGCMVAAGHKRCPLNQECEAKAIFN